MLVSPPLADAAARGGPTEYTQATLPDWNGNYWRDASKTANWYHGAVLQIPTYLTLLTPEYQTRFVQQMYHYAVSNAPQWPASYYQPEGFMRRIAQYSGFTPSVMMTPELVQVLNVTAGNFITHVLVGRKFKEDGTTIEYTVPDVYGRPWAQIWERYFEQGMEHPQPEPLFGFE